MRDKILFGAIGTALLIILLKSDTFIINLAVAVVSFVTISELNRALNFVRNPIVSLLSLAETVAFTYVFSQNSKNVFITIFLFIFALFLVYMIWPNKIKFTDIASAFFTTIYVCLMSCTVVMVRKMAHGQNYIWLVFIAAYVTDTFAYFTGKLFGRHKPFKLLSPNKTTEGVIGGVSFCVAGFLIFAYVLETQGGMKVNYVNAAIVGAISSLMGVFGDLAASRIKREHGLKDFSGLIPGHGGVMDRIDSVLFTAPTVYVLLNLLPILS